MTEQGVGPGLKAHNGSRSVDPRDPTENVRELLREAVAHLNDLRVDAVKYMEMMIVAETRRVNEQMDLRADYIEKLSQAEAKRIDAIRAVDVNAVSVATERATAQAAVLANQVATSADALRALVAATANTVAQQLAQLTEQFTSRLSSLEKAQYEGKGKEAVQDPIMATLVNEVKKLGDALTVRQGSGLGMRDMWGWIFGALMALVMLGVATGVIHK